MEKITAEILGDVPQFTRVTVETDGTSVSKRIRTMDFARDLLVGQDAEGYGPAVWSLPDTLSVFRMNQSGRSGKFILYVPAGKKNMLYSTEKKGRTQRVAFPPIILYFHVQDMRVKNSCAFAVKEEHRTLITGDTVLFNYPYGNVNPNSGSICWGGNTFERLETFKTLDEYVGLFLTSQTNNDLFQGGRSVKCNNLAALVSQMAKADSFDLELLVPAGGTVASLLG